MLGVEASTAWWGRGSRKTEKLYQRGSMDRHPARYYAGNVAEPLVYGIARQQGVAHQGNGSARFLA